MAFTKTAIAFIWKMITYKNGANALFSFCASSGITTGLWLSGNLERFNNIFIKDADPKSIFFPFLVESVMIILFLPLTGLDFILGQRVARVIRKENFKPERFFDTMIKAIAIILVTSVLMFLAFGVGTVTKGGGWLWGLLMVALSFFWVLAIGFEFSSVGRNFELLNGSKSAIFKFFDKILIVLQDKAIKKVESSFNLEIDDEKDNDNNN